MKRLFVLVVAGLVLLAASCDTKNIGTGLPERGPQPVVTVPAGMNGGADAVWSCAFTGGTAPYTIAWAFGGGGADVPTAAATSPNTQTVTMINPSLTDSATYTYSVTVTDAQNLFNTATGTYTVGPTLNTAPTIDSSVWDGAAGTLTVTASDVDDDTVAITVTPPAGFTIDAPTKNAAATGSAVFSLSADDFFAGGSGDATVAADDGNGGTASTTTAISAAALVLAADTLYVIPLAGAVATATPITIVVATGDVANFQFLNGAGVCVESDASYVGGTFNAGAPGGANDAADGAWGPMAPTTGFLLPPDTLIQATDIGGGRERWDFNLTPIGGSDQTMNGALFNFQFEFSAAGTKALGFQAVSGVNRTYFSNGASTETFWGTLHADETGSSNVPAVGNTIVVS